MLIRCPACGAQTSLDVVVDDAAAAEALRQALELAPLGPRIVRYLALFRPVKTRLTWPRVNALLAELLPCIKGGCVTRNGQTTRIDEAAWAAALDEVIAARDGGQLRLPLKSHGYLFEVAIRKSVQGLAVGRNKPQALPAEPPFDSAQGGPPTPTSATARAIAKLQARKRRED